MGVIETRDVDISQLPGVLEGMSQGKVLTFEKSMKESSVYLAGQAKDCFAGSHDPDGNPWKKLKRPRRRKRDKRAKGGSGQKPLVDRGILAASMSATASTQGAIRDIGPTHLEQGSNVFHGPFHQFGTRHIPKREFAGITDKAADRIEQFVGADAERQLVG